tara:strand:- start:553 stop:789 length:237 start_codon:yes stop_codon:yes gene_type:complete
MANDSVNDRYAPPGIGSNDFERFKFDEIEDEDLFWLNQSVGYGDSNPPFRKMNNRQGHNTKTGIVKDFGLQDIVFQRT